MSKSYCVFKVNEPICSVCWRLTEQFESNIIKIGIVLVISIECHNGLNQL
jgi:hypothetical protein